MPLHSGTSPRQERLLAVIHQYAIRTNPAPDALFSFAVSTLTIWCVPTDHPGGLWNQFPWQPSPASRLTKPGAESLSKSLLLYSETAQDIIGFTLQTQALSLMSRSLLPRSAIENRPEDVAWATRKLIWLWAQAFPAELPPQITLKWDRDEPKEYFSDIY
jgi:hypothetical protein